MSGASEHRPVSPLGQQLLAAARDDDPPRSSVQRALEQVDADAGAPAPTRRWWRWALPAAAVVLGSVAFAFIRLGGNNESVVAEPLPAAAMSAAPTSATTSASAVKMAVALPTASASAATSSSASRAPSTLAQRRPATPVAKTAAKPPAASKRVGSCGCAPTNLMCVMRCKQKKK